MKRLFFWAVFVTVGLVAFAQSNTITFKVSSYLINRKETAQLYVRAELTIDDETQSWEIILHRKDGTNPERIKLEKPSDISRNNMVFRTVAIQEGAGPSGANLYAFVPPFQGSKIRVDICDAKTEGVKRRLILEY
ncbi:MAG: hypothetical protein LBB72_03105 [Spirochaetaceae bacterium]|jgi:hypothetical protein|nr:hypothetical protein [Spirochaetaceae bacterium]